MSRSPGIAFGRKFFFGDYLLRESFSMSHSSGIAFGRQTSFLCVKE